MGAAMLLTAAAVIGVGASPAGAEARVRVHPTTDLIDQQKVRVAVSDFPFLPAGENRIAVIQCAAEATDIDGCGDFTGINLTLDASGSAATRYRVSRILHTPAFGAVDCAAAPQRCLLAVINFQPSLIFTVPLSFDPAVPPLPPVDIDATLDPTARVNPQSGVVRVSGTVSCTTPTPIRILGNIGQQQPETQIFSFVDFIVQCTGTERWSARVRSSTPGTAFTEGLGIVSLTVVVDRSGPGDRVEINTFSLPFVAHPRAS
jgi:hypothetical protein